MKRDQGYLSVGSIRVAIDRWPVALAASKVRCGWEAFEVVPAPQKTCQSSCRSDAQSERSGALDRTDHRPRGPRPNGVASWYRPGVE
jgi:hypothetical protein